MKSNATPEHTSDLKSLVSQTMDDIGALFEVLAVRLDDDQTSRSLATTGGYLCDKWRDLICDEIARNGQASTPASTGQLVAELNIVRA